MNVEEIEISFDWGKIVGKWWGPRNIRPIVVLHGWQDNAGSFDTLIPLLPSEMSYLALDFPGHGLSSHLPNGLFYSYMDFVYLLNYVRVHFNWDRMSFMAHSMGSIVSFIYAGVFPNRVDMLIALDTLKPLVRRPEININFMSFRGENLPLVEQRNREVDKEPPNYTYAEMIERMVDGTRGSVTAEMAPFLLKRGIKTTSLHPERYYFSRDSRMKYVHEAYFDQGICLELAKRIQVPHLFIKSSDSSFSEIFRNITETINLLKKKNPKFEVHHVQGTHHVHLNNPERVFEIISKFLRKYGDEMDLMTDPIKSKL